MAGCHQVWGLDPTGGRLDLVCGTGREALIADTYNHNIKVLYPSLQRV
jgi:hypothetical protein